MSVSSGQPSALATRHWLATMAMWRRWFSYSVEGMEHLRTHECKIVVGYHGRPLAWDLFLLGAEIHREQGYLPLALVHRNFMDWPYLRWLTEGLVWTTGKGPILDDAIAKGRHVILAPGGAPEGLRPGWVRYQVDWPAYGYLRQAISRGVEVVPVAAAGVDDAYFGLNDSEQIKTLLGIKDRNAAVWAGFGPLGLYPWSPPFPVHIHQIIGPPIVPVYPVEARLDLLNDPAAMLELHTQVQATVQELLERARLKAAEAGAQLTGARRPRHERLRGWLASLAEFEDELPWHKHNDKHKTPAGR